MTTDMDSCACLLMLTLQLQQIKPRETATGGKGGDLLSLANSLDTHQQYRLMLMIEMAMVGIRSQIHARPSLVNCQKSRTIC